MNPYPSPADLIDRFDSVLVQYDEWMLFEAGIPTEHVFLAKRLVDQIRRGHTHFDSHEADQQELIMYCGLRGMNAVERIAATARYRLVDG